MWWKIFAIIELVATVAGIIITAADEITVISLISLYFAISSVVIVCLYAFNKPLLAGRGASSFFYMYIAYLVSTHGYWLRGFPTKISSGDASLLTLAGAGLSLGVVDFLELLAIWRYSRGETQHSKTVVS